MSGKGGGSTTSVQKSDPWSGVQPSLQHGFSEANRLYGNNGPQYFPGQTYAPPNTAQLNSAYNIADKGLNGTQVGNAASGAVTGVLNGSPGMTSFLASQVMPQIQGQFAAGNRMDSGLASRAVGSGMSDALLNNQLKYAAIAPTLNDMQFQNLDQAMGAGQTMQGLDQNVINDAMQRWNYNQQLPYSNLNNFISEIQGNFGGTSTLTQPYSQNMLGNALGGALGGGMLGNSLGGMLGMSGGMGSGLGSLLGLGLAFL